MLTLGVILNLLLIKEIEKEKLRLLVEEKTKLSRKYKRFTILKLKQKFKWLYRKFKDLLKKLVQNFYTYRNTYFFCLILLSLCVSGVFIYKNNLLLKNLPSQLDEVYFKQLEFEEKASKNWAVLKKIIENNLKEFNQVIIDNRLINQFNQVLLEKQNKELNELSNQFSELNEKFSSLDKFMRS